MEIPLTLSSPKPDRLVYGFPLWYRGVMGGIIVIVVASLLISEAAPGFLAWLILTMLLLAALYEDKWIFDAAEQTATHRAGLLFASRARVITFADITAYRIVPFVKGTVPGTADEKEENEAALRGGRPESISFRQARHKKPFLSLEIECMDDSRFLIDHVPARKAEDLRAMASRIAALCGKPLTEA